MKSRIKIELTVLLVLIGIAGWDYMMSHPVTPKRIAGQENVVPVSILEISFSDEQVVVNAQGTVTPAQQVQLTPEVSGKIIELSRQLVPGGLLEAGQAIAHIDPRDYQVRITAQQEAIARAKLLLRQERARQKVAEQEWELLDSSIPVDEENRDLALRIPQIEQATSALAAAEGALQKAELDLERCRITAPFDAVVMAENVDLGQVVNPQTRIATLVGTDYYWVQVALPVEDLVWITVPTGNSGHGSRARVIHRAGGLEISREGRVQRLLGDVDPAGRLARLLVVIEDPRGLSGQAEPTLPLLIGSYVTVEIQGRTVTGVVRVPRKALREIESDATTGTSEGLWIMDSDDRLAIRSAEVIWRTSQTVLVQGGLASGERIVTSIISTPIAGMKLMVAPAGIDS